MSESGHVNILQRLVEAFEGGSLDVFDELLMTEFYDYVPREGEQTAPEAFHQVAADINGAFPDLSVTLSNLTETGDKVRGTVSMEGAFTGTLWGLPGNGQRQNWSAGFETRFHQDKAALSFEDINLIGVLRGLGIAPAPENAHLKPEHPIQIPEIIIRLAFNGMRLEEKACSHLDQIKVIEPSTDVCEQCVAAGDEWPALRMCLVCGFTGCCDTSKNKHVKRHCEETGHPIVRSIMPGEGWIWCYEDSALLSSWHLKQ